MSKRICVIFSKYGSKRCLLFFFILCLATACTDKAVKESRIGEWTIYHFSNHTVSIDVVPLVGGRILQYRLGDHGFFFVNADQLGKLLPPATLGKVGAWGNQGGAKLWPAPQGWDGHNQWPGPPDPVLDGGAYTVLEKSDLSITLQSPDDKEYTGIRFTQKVSLDSTGSGISFDVVMKNISDQPIRWGIWSHVQLDASLSGSADFNHLHLLCPLNPDSRFEKGFDVIFGDKENPSYRITADSSKFEAEYLYKVGKVGIDSPGNWVATLNPKTGDVFVQKYAFVADAVYPENSSVEVWTNGIGRYHAFGQDMAGENDPTQNPYILESEILSPYASLKPNEEYHWSFRWFATNLGEGETRIWNCMEAGVIASEPKAIILAKNGGHLDIQLSGKFGVFYPGKLVAEVLNSKGKTLTEVVLKEDISPLHPVRLQNMDMKVPLEGAVLKLNILHPSLSARKTLALIPFER
ncbi:MAG: hypothetical protein EZS26_003687 [Candidatus Ordinivivax streblomastigis]|uniref:DUF4380 domain-containing protein n=1 Tax=Candidatus Ordinivivax streblomastigis TaxID=2540710 RepID=A0A5M8NSV6_9BACT|nr:MAG: hypothetical protein EZS26_003687 [Candidatus Ordinivivax streblomastigis]